MNRLVCAYSINEMESLIRDIPKANLMHAVFLKIVNAYMERCNVPWFGCRRVDWYEIALMTIQQSYEVRRTLYNAGKLLYRSYSRPGLKHGIPIVVHTTMPNPPVPRPETVYIYQPGEEYNGE